MRIPKSWKEITIRQFIRVDEAIKAEYDEPIDQHIAIIAAVCNVSVDDILRLDKNELPKIVESLSFLHNLDSISTKWPKWFVINGRVFKPVQKLDKLTAGQYIDLMTFAKDPMPNLHKVLATLCLPVKWFRAQKYDGRKHAELSQFFYENLTMDIAYPIALFFCKVLENCTPHILDYLEKEIENLTMTPEMKGILRTASLSSLAGFTHSTNSREATPVNGTTISH